MGIQLLDMCLEGLQFILLLIILETLKVVELQILMLIILPLLLVWVLVNIQLLQVL